MSTHTLVNSTDDLVLILGDGQTEIVVSTYSIFTL